MDQPSVLIQDIQKGRMVVLMDDEQRENEGDLVIAAHFVTPESVNFMLHHARGLLCLVITQKQANKLKLPFMVSQSMLKSGNHNQAAFTVSVDAAKGIGSGASVFDRTHTIKVVANPCSSPEDIVIPGHVFPIVAKDLGILERAGHTEGSLDLVKLAGLYPAAVICEILNDDGQMAHRPDLQNFAAKHSLKIGCIEDLISYRQSYFEKCE